MSTYDGSAGWLAGDPRQRPAVRDVPRPRRVRGGSSARPGRCGWVADPLGGRAEPVPGGDRFNGRATNASGSHHADWADGRRLGRPRRRESWIDGRPEMIAGILPIADATIEDTVDHRHEGHRQRRRLLRRRRRARREDLRVARPGGPLGRRPAAPIRCTPSRHRHRGHRRRHRRGVEQRFDELAASSGRRRTPPSSPSGPSPRRPSARRLASLLAAEDCPRCGATRTVGVCDLQDVIDYDVRGRVAAADGHGGNAARRCGRSTC